MKPESVKDSVTDDAEAGDFSRRRFLALAAGAVAVPLGACSPSQPAGSQVPTAGAQAPRSRVSPPPNGPHHNILFVFTDQERYFPRWPKGFSLPGHERLAATGTTFTNHYCPAVMCTSSRAVILTGLQTPDNRMFENCDLPYVKALSPDVPTIGHMLRKAGYYTAYKGKWHLNAAFDSHEGNLFDQEMEQYGFADFFWPGDALAHALGGYSFDHVIVGTAQSWLRKKGRPLSDDGKPWALFVSLVNPHDIMYLNTDAPGQAVQDTGRLALKAARAPHHALFEAKWNAPLPSNLTQPLDQAGRPGAHAEFHKAWDYTLGNIPLEAERWQRFNDFYLNCIRSVDLQVARLLSELDDLGLTDSTIVVFTSDHGEMAGAHGLRGKGPFAYEEGVHLPLHIVHPDVRGGQESRSVTGHIDFVPTLLSMAGVAPGKFGELAGRELPGKDFSGVLGGPGRTDVHAVREGALFTYSGLAQNDAELMRLVAEGKSRGQSTGEALKSSGYQPNLKKRGSVRTVCDGRYKFSRYFSPLQRNSPKNIDELYRWNDVELFDLRNDPAEMTNLAADKTKNAELISTMSAKLESVIKAEIGVDDGREMPKVEGIDWAIDRIDM